MLWKERFKGKFCYYYFFIEDYWGPIVILIFVIIMAVIKQDLFLGPSDLLVRALDFDDMTVVGIQIPQWTNVWVMCTSICIQVLDVVFKYVWETTPLLSVSGYTRMFIPWRL